MPENGTPVDIAFIGLGNMGAPVSAPLPARGFVVHASDLAAEARLQLEAAGGKAYSNPAAAVASADAVIHMLPFSDIVKRVILDDGALAALRPDRILPVLEVLGHPTYIVPVGAGHGLKAPNNLMSATHLLITSEAVLAGEKFGIDPAVMLEAVNGSSDEVDPPTTNGLTSFFQARITQDSTCPK